MKLPEAAQFCMDKLEAAGFATYAVGGCVRDHLLGLEPHDYDLCTAATPEEIRTVFEGFGLVRSGEKHGTVGIIIDHQVYEITTFRTEGGYKDSRHPDWVAFVTDINEDLARRDFTVNAMAFSPTRGYADPWGGQADLQKRVLRAVGDPATRFTEDALRILRGVRFAVKYGLTPEKKTLKAMVALAPTMEKLAKERIFDELCKLLPLISAKGLIFYAPILLQVLPELAPCVDFDQKNHHHVYDVYTHTAHVVEQVPASLPLRWAALLHDIGKPACFAMGEDGEGHFYGHAKVSAQMADQILRRLKSPTALREQVVTLIEQHMTPLEPDKKLLRRRMSKLGTDMVWDLVRLQEADHLSTDRNRPDRLPMHQVRKLLLEIVLENACLSLKDLKITGRDLIGLGYTPGPAIGQTLSHLLNLVQDEVIENDTGALLSEALKELDKKKEDET